MFIDTRVATATLLIMVKHTPIFSLELQNIWRVCTGKRLNNIKHSAVSDHLLQCNYTTDSDHSNILATDVTKFNLSVKESLLIKRDNPVLNKTTKSFPLELFNQFYCHCFLVLYQILLYIIIP